MPDDMIRGYTASDRAACLALFDGNTPRFFATSERAEFERFLDRHAAEWAFRVIDRDRQVVACGGFAVGTDGRTAHLCWGMVAHGLHRQGLGRRLAEARLAAASAHPGICDVHLDTSQHSYRFYARLGFRTERVTPDGYGPGLDRYDMVRPIRGDG